MDLREISSNQQVEYDKLVSHVIQSWQWGEFRKKMGLTLLRYGIYQNKKLNTAFQLSLHKIPLLDKYVGYLPKGPLPDHKLADALKMIGQQQNCAFIKIEPNVIVTSNMSQESRLDPVFIPSAKLLFTKYNFIIDLTQSEENLLKNMHPKTRYNIKLAQKHAVRVEERVDDEAFEIYLKLYFETTKRQGYLGHNKAYHQKAWLTLKDAGMARLLIAYYRNPTSDIRHPLAAWMLFNFKDTLYYPYGGSSTLHKEVMASNLVAWEAIKLGKKMGLKKLDLWGALRPDADTKDPWYGFHRFKSGLGGELVEYLGTFDLVFNNFIYQSFTTMDKFTKLKVALLKLLG